MTPHSITSDIFPCYYSNNLSQDTSATDHHTVESRSTDTHLIRTLFCAPSHKLLYIVNTPLPMDTGFPRTFYFPSHNHMLIVEIERCSNNDRFLWVNTIFFTVKKKKKKQQQNSAICLVLISPPFSSSLTLVLKPFNKVFCFLLNKFHFLGFFLQSLFPPRTLLPLCLLHVCITNFLRARLIRRTGECGNCGMSPWCCPY